jgi:hypothetical protein
VAYISRRTVCIAANAKAAKGLPAAHRAHRTAEKAGEGAWLVCGRRAGKSLVLATIAVYLAAFCDWRRFLGPGELATIMIIARDRGQARVIKRFITGLLRETPMLGRIIEKQTADGIRLRNRVAIEIHTASFRSTRGYTIVAALLDEIAFWPTDEGSAEPDIEVINAIKPGMATIPNAMLLCASSPHARRGALWNVYRNHFGKQGDPVLVWQAATRDMNSSVPQSFIDEHMAEDPARAQAEYLAQFRTDVERFVSPEIVEACVGDFHERPPMTGFVYSGFVDPSGGSDAAMTLAIGHKTTAPEKQIIIDVIREVRPPFDPFAVVADLAALLKTYRISKVLGDHYGGEFVKEPFRKEGINYEVCKTPKSDLFRDLLPLLNSRHITLPQHDRVIAQIVGLERLCRGPVKIQLHMDLTGKMISLTPSRVARLPCTKTSMIRSWVLEMMMTRTAHEGGRLTGSGNILCATGNCGRYRHGLATLFRVQLFRIIEP